MTERFLQIAQFMLREGSDLVGTFENKEALDLSGTPPRKIKEFCEEFLMILLTGNPEGCFEEVAKAIEPDQMHTLLYDKI